MSNMSYCRFENTLHDLQDCHEQLEELKDGGEPTRIGSSNEREREARVELVDLCMEVAEMFAECADSNDRKEAIQKLLEKWEADLPDEEGEED